MAFVYFIQEGKTDIFKIGITEKNVTNRLRSIQTGSSKKLRIFGTIETDNQVFLENHLHFILSKHRLFGEWFRLNPLQVLEYLRQFETKPDLYKVNICIELNDIGKPPELLTEIVYTAAPWKLFLFQANGMVLMTIVMFIMFLAIGITFLLHPDGNRMLMSLITAKEMSNFPQ